MKLGIMQPYFFPYIGYFQLMKAVNSFIIYDDVNYIKRGWVNRNRILIRGTDQFITLPLVKPSQNVLIKDILIHEPLYNKSKLLKTINHSYQKAPFFHDVFPLLELILSGNHINLVEFIKFSIEIINDYLDIRTRIELSTSLKKNELASGQDKIIQICKIKNADVYVNPIGGINLYDQCVFAEHGIKLIFLQAKYIEYLQFNAPFKPNLSIIDVMMFNSRQRLHDILGEFLYV